MPRPSKAGVRGLYKFKDEHEKDRYRIDLRYSDPSGAQQRYKEVQPPGVTATAFKLHAADVLAQARAGTLVKRGAEGPGTLGEAFDAYLAWVQTNRPKAHRNRKSIVAVWLEAVGEVSIDRLGPELLETYKATRLKEGAAPATINRGIAMVKHMAGVAARSGWPWMTRVQAAVIREVGMLKEPPGRQRPIKPAELQAILAAFKRVDARFARRVVAAALLTGCRLGELVSLHESQLDLKKRTIDLPTTKQNRNHQIVITPPLANLLKEALADRGKKPDGYVFVSSHGTAYTVDGFSKHFAHVAERARVPDITFHDLRRHVGTVLINAGERLEVVSKLLGHSNVAVTQRSYAHLATDATRAAFDTLARIAPALPPATRAPVANRRKSA